MTHSIFDADAAVDRKRHNSHSHQPKAAFGYDVDGTTYSYDQPTITGAQLLFSIGLYPQQGLVRVLSDGSRVTVTATQTIDLTSGARFNRRPKFKRG